MANIKQNTTNAREGMGEGSLYSLLGLQTAKALWSKWEVRKLRISNWTLLPALPHSMCPQTNAQRLALLVTAALLTIAREGKQPFTRTRFTCKESWNQQVSGWN